MSTKENLTKMDEKEKMEPKNVSNPRKGRRGSRKTANEAEKDPKKTVAETNNKGQLDPVDMMFV